MKVVKNSKMILMVGTFALLSVACESEKKETEKDSVSLNALSVDLPLADINASNFESYIINGDCLPELGSVEINFSNIISNSVCGSNGKFSANLNLQTLSNSELMGLLVKQGELEFSLFENSMPKADLVAISEAPRLQGQSFVNSDEYTAEFYCAEEGEKVYFSGAGLEPSLQVHECSSSIDRQEIKLTLLSDTETGESNLISVRSYDSMQNPTQQNTTFNLSIDNKPPSIAITAQGDIGYGDVATFVVDVQDANLDFSGLDFLPSSGWVSSPACESFPCIVKVTDADEGLLKLTAEQGTIRDLAGNSNEISVTEEITVSSPTTLASSN